MHAAWESIEGVTHGERLLLLLIIAGQQVRCAPAAHARRMLQRDHAAWRSWHAPVVGAPLVEHASVA
jgi:hypothetical protein